MTDAYGRVYKHLSSSNGISSWLGNAPWASKDPNGNAGAIMRSRYDVTARNPNAMHKLRHRSDILRPRTPGTTGFFDFTSTNPKGIQALQADDAAHV